MPTRIRQTRQALNDALAGAETLDETVAAADAVLRSALDAESAAWGTIDPSTMLSTSCRLFGALDRGGGALPQAAVERERRLFEYDDVVVTSPAAQELLASLEEQQVATVLVSLAASTRANGSTSIVASGPGGPVALHGAPAKGTDGDVAVVVERPRPIELAPLIMQAMGFTARERVVTELLLSGSSRRQIGRRLAVSDHTVGGHLRQVYRKAGVASRGELAARLYGQFYEARRAAQTPPSPYGYFVGR